MTKSLVIALVVAAGGAAGLTAWWLATTRHTGPATAVVPVATAAVVRTNLATTTQMSGTIGYADSYTITAELPGTITALPGPGAVVTRGHPAFEVDGSGVFLFYGTRPAWRSFEIGMTPGPDVLELEQNLAALGYAGDIYVDDTFTWGTDEAIRRWQFATGQLETGHIDLGRITFAPGAVRVNGDVATLGGAAEPGQPVISASSPDPVVNVPVPAAQNLSRPSGRPGHRDHAVGRNEYWPSRRHLIDRHRGDRVSRGRWAVLSTERSAAGNCPGRRVPRSSVCGIAPRCSAGHRQRNGPTSLRRSSGASHRSCRARRRRLRGVG